ncbi:putative ABC transporter ATP-binding protein YxlF [Oxobacter pfennigii]|uniref:Putative ABC transporter ATP-binding protein YxlF n=1 Tax=Oxobacter pfennigii TaxID=36849 RepID=A0A0P8W6N4_9CLOT|nr:ATP-binding cassette domain-containing protein [Oxobacter pfennigii]KPU44372.1 putative ABC transporter ATP-binding protein YxlF [Oxobacter pfennigii]
MKLTIKNISKNYGKKQALKGVSFEMENGVYGLLGPNGAGKSTLIRILVGVMGASGGEVFMNGINRKSCDREYRRALGYLPQSLDFYPEFSGLDYLRFVAVLKGLKEDDAEKKIKTLVERVGLANDLHRKCINYSGGMKRRLGIAQALLNDPEILILDEPTAGLDPHERIRFRNLVSIFSRDRTVLLSTHIVSDIDSIAKKTIMIKGGKVGRMESTQSFVDAIAGKVWNVKMTVDELVSYQDSHIISNVLPIGDRMEVRVVSDEKPSLNAISVPPTLEDAYLHEFQFEGGISK